MEVELSKLKVSPVYDYFDRSFISSVLERHHPLGDKAGIGRRISYAASYRGVWVAVAVFDKAVDRNKYREATIGWNDSQRRERVQHIANNSRFLVLPKFQSVPNLASKVLSLIEDRISEDWLKQYGVPLLGLETYVDPDYNGNQGTCYIAAGWEKLGLSSGYVKANGERTHGKWYFLKLLNKDSRPALSAELPHALLTGVKSVSGKSNNNYVLDSSKIDLKKLRKALETIKDPRSKQGRRYNFIPFLSLCISAVLSGYTQYRQIADWIARLPSQDRVRYGMPGHRSPSESMISVFLRKIDPDQLDKALTGWLLETYGEKNIKTVSLDGKMLRATSSEAKEKVAFLNVYANELGIVIAQLPTKKGGGEKKQAKQVLRQEPLLEGKTVLADAIHTDKELVELLEKKSVNTSLRSRAIRAILRNN